MHDLGLTVRVTFGSFRVPCTGDPKTPTERRMVATSAGNRSGHPLPEAVFRLQVADTEVYGTVVQGTVPYTSDEQQWSVQTG